MKRKACLLTLIAAALLLCGCRGKNFLMQPDEPAIQEQVEIDEDATQEAITAELFRTARYESRHIIFEYPEDVFQLSETMTDVDGETYLVSLTPMEDSNTVLPRIDVMSVALKGTIDAMREVATDEKVLKNCFGDFAKELISGYYEGIGPSISIIKTEAHVEEDAIDCSAELRTVEHGSLPALRAFVKLNGKGEYGHAAVVLYPESMDAQSVAILDEIGQSIQYIP